METRLWLKLVRYSSLHTMVASALKLLNPNTKGVQGQIQTPNRMQMKGLHALTSAFGQCTCKIGREFEGASEAERG